MYPSSVKIVGSKSTSFDHKMQTNEKKSNQYFTAHQERAFVYCLYGPTNNPKPKDMVDKLEFTLTENPYK